MDFEYKIYGKECELTSYIGFDDNLIEIPEDINGYAVVAFNAGLFEGMKISKIKFPSNLRYIGEGAFRNCTCLKEVEFHENIILCCAHAFENCKSLERIDLGRVAYLGKGCFEDCVKLKDVKMSDFLVDTGGDCFSGCYSLQNIQLSLNLGAIRENDFWGTAIKKIVIPSKTMLIENDAFANCDDLKEIKSFSVDCKIGEYAFSKYNIHRPYKQDGTEDLRYEPRRYDYFVQRNIYCLAGSSFQSYARKYQHILNRNTDVERQYIGKDLVCEIEDPTLYYSYNHCIGKNCSRENFLSEVGLPKIDAKYCFHDNMQKFVCRVDYDDISRIIRCASKHFYSLRGGCKIYTTGKNPIMTFEHDKIVPYKI